MTVEEYRSETFEQQNVRLCKQVKGLRETVEDLENELRKRDKVIADLNNLCVRSYKYLSYWFSSLKGEGMSLWTDLHKKLYMDACTDHEVSA